MTWAALACNGSPVSSPRISHRRTRHQNVAEQHPCWALATQPGDPGLRRHGLVGGPGRLGRVPLPHVRPVHSETSAKCWSTGSSRWWRGRIGQPPRNLHASVRMRAVGHRQEGRQRLRLDHFIYPQYRLGNIREHRLVDFTFLSGRKFAATKATSPLTVGSARTVSPVTASAPESLRQDARQHAGLNSLLGSEALSRPCRAAPARDHRPASFDHNVNNAGLRLATHTGKASAPRSHFIWSVPPLQCHRSRKSMEKSSPTCQY